MANIGNGLGSLLSGIAGGAIAGKALKGASNKGITPLGIGLADSGDKAGFGLGGKLVMGALGDSQMAGDGEKDGPWSLLSSIISSNSDSNDQSGMAGYAPGGLPRMNSEL